MRFSIYGNIQTFFKLLGLWFSQNESLGDAFTCVILYLYYYLRSFPYLRFSILIPKIPSIYFLTRFSTNRIKKKNKKIKNLLVEFHFPCFTFNMPIMLSTFSITKFIFFFLLQLIIFKFPFPCFTPKKMLFNLFSFFFFFFLLQPITSNY